MSFMHRGTDLEQARPSRSHEVTLDWLATAERLGQRVDLDASAHTLGAMLRRRGVPSATNLLCLALLYGPARMPLRLIAERSAVLGIARVSEPALLRRLINAADWLEHLVDVLILERLDGLARPIDRPQGGPMMGEPLEHQIAQLRLAAATAANPFDVLTPHDRRARQAEMAKRFIFDFLPWPDDLYTDAQIHWLLCLRWMFVSSTIKDGPISRAESEPLPASALERSRQMAHLLGALASGEV
jgi:hypothetical protein